MDFSDRLKAHINIINFPSRPGLADGIQHLRKSDFVKIFFHLKLGNSIQLWNKRTNNQTHKQIWYLVILCTIAGVFCQHCQCEFCGHGFKQVSATPKLCNYFSNFSNIIQSNPLVMGWRIIWWWYWRKRTEKLWRRRGGNNCTA